jgi:hypothetical protein
MYPRSQLAFAVNYFASGQDFCRALRWVVVALLHSHSTLSKGAVDNNMSGVMHAMACMTCNDTAGRWDKGHVATAVVPL